MGQGLVTVILLAQRSSLGDPWTMVRLGHSTLYDLQPRFGGAFLSLFVFRAFIFLRHQLGLQEYRKLNLPGRSADVVQAISRGEQ